MEKFWGNIERLIDLYKRYRSPLHARLAWVVVIAGIALSATPWWLPLLAQLIERHTDLDTDQMLAWAAQTDPAYSLGIIGFGLLYHGWSMWHTAREQGVARLRTIEQDRSTYKAFTALASEEGLRDFLQHMLGDHSYYDRDFDMITRAIDHMRLRSNQYHDDDLNRTVEDLRQSFDELARFLQTDFDFYPPIQNFPRGNRYCLHPYWNIDRGGHGRPDENRQYDEAAARLHDLSSGAMVHYEKLVMTAKKKLI